ncbi:AF4/FMR2 family member 1 [Hoplias malabaricus]|uniref:AF4/FMR2 family member 1 n=1 Tax=Hoplias malabaricus TaxID=27720 RepID=UPI003462CADA
MASRATSNLAQNPPRTMAGQSSLREELNVLRRREWERRNQEAPQERELFQDAPLFGEPYKTNKGDELSRIIQRMLGNYEDGNSSQFSQFDGVTKDRPPVSSHARSWHPAHMENSDLSFQNATNYSTGQSGHHLGQPSKKYPALDGLTEPPAESQQRNIDGWPDMRDYATLPAVLPDLSPPAEPLSPLHSSESSDSDQDMDENDHSVSREHNGSPSRTEPLHHTEVPKEVPQSTVEAPPLASQTFPLTLSSKPNLANSGKPTALVRPNPVGVGSDGPEQVTSESPDLKPSPDDFHRQSYESLPELKNGSKPSLPPLKMPPQSVETLSSEVHSVEEILREMTHSLAPLLTAIHTPSTTETAKFSFPSKEPHLHPGYQQPQKHHDSPPRAPLSPCRPDPVVPEDVSAAALAPSSGVESSSSSESESSSGSESESESSESGTEENPAAQRENTPPVQTEGMKDISWQLIRWIKESQQNRNPQNHHHSQITPDAKTAPSSVPQPHSQTQEEPKTRNKQHYNSHNPPTTQQLESTEEAGSKSTSLGQPSSNASHKPISSLSETTHRKTVGNKQPGKSSKAPKRQEESRPSLQVESVEVTPHDKESLFTEKPRVKTKSKHEKSSKSDDRKSAKHHSDKKDGKATLPKATVTVERVKDIEPDPPPSTTTLRSTSPPHKSSVQTETIAPAKSSKKSRARSPSREKKVKKEAASKRVPDPPQSLVVKIELSHLSRVPQAQKSVKTSESSSKKTSHEKTSHGSAAKESKKRPAEKSETPVPKKKPKLEKESKSPVSSRHSSSKTEARRNSSENKVTKSSKKSHPPPPPPPPHSSQEQPKSSGHKRRSGEPEENSSSSSKHKKKSSSKEEHDKGQKKAPKSSASVSDTAASCTAPQTLRPLLRFEERQFSVEYHMKEAKKLKHKADATLDKMGKAFNYLDAAMSFVESGIAMETDPQTPKSAYTMFSETVDLIRFILKLKNYLDPSSPASERDFLVLCMRCQALLQMAMFRCKRDSALKYSRTLTDHFKSSKNVQAPSPCVSKSTGTPSPMSPTPSPVSSASSGAASNPSSSSSSSTVVIPQVIQQVASSYVSITALFLSAHDTWEQTEELARRGSGIFAELDTALGQLSLTSGMTSLVRYTRQGLHWLKLDASNPR